MLLHTANLTLRGLSHRVENARSGVKIIIHLHKCLPFWHWKSTLIDSSLLALALSLFTAFFSKPVFSIKLLWNYGLIHLELLFHGHILAGEILVLGIRPTHLVAGTVSALLLIMELEFTKKDLHWIMQFLNSSLFNNFNFCQKLQWYCSSQAPSHILCL